MELDLRLCLCVDGFQREGVGEFDGVAGDAGHQRATDGVERAGGGEELDGGAVAVGLEHVAGVDRAAEDDFQGAVRAAEQGDVHRNFQERRFRRIRADAERNVRVGRAGRDVGRGAADDDEVETVRDGGVGQVGLVAGRGGTFTDVGEDRQVTCWRGTVGVWSRVMGFFVFTIYELLVVAIWDLVFEVSLGA